MLKSTYKKISLKEYIYNERIYIYNVLINCHVWDGT